MPTETQPPFFQVFPHTLTHTCLRPYAVLWHIVLLFFLCFFVSAGRRRRRRCSLPSLSCVAPATTTTKAGNILHIYYLISIKAHFPVRSLGIVNFSISFMPRCLTHTHTHTTALSNIRTVVAMCDFCSTLLNRDISQGTLILLSIIFLHSPHFCGHIPRAICNGLFCGNKKDRETERERETHKPQSQPMGASKFVLVAALGPFSTTTTTATEKQCRPGERERERECVRQRAAAADAAALMFTRRALSAALSLCLALRLFIHYLI